MPNDHIAPEQHRREAEGVREKAEEHGRARQLAQQRGRSSLFPELAGS